MSTSETTTPEHAAPMIPAVPRRWLRWVTVLLAALGWWLSFDLYRLSFQVAPSNPLLGALCDTATDGPCGSVLGSPWGGVAISPGSGARMPVSVFGMAYFAFVGFWFLLIGCPTRSRRAWHSVIVAVVALGLLASAQYTLLMAGTLKQWCAGCVAVHVTNLLIGLATIAAFPWRGEALPYEPHPRGRLVIATFMGGGFLFLLHLTVGLMQVQGALTRQVAGAYARVIEDPAYIVWKYRQQERVEIPPRSRPAWFGPPDAPHTLVAFLDFACPNCREADRAIRAALERYPQRLRVDFRQFPLDHACNPDLQRSLHPGACQAAVQAEAARALAGPDAFRAIKTALYQRGRPLNDREARTLAAAQGWDHDAWSALLDTAATEQLREDIAAGHQTGVTAVPALYLNGRRLLGWSEGAWEVLLGEASEGGEGGGEGTKEPGSE